MDERHGRRDKRRQTRGDLGGKRFQEQEKRVKVHKMRDEGRRSRVKGRETEQGRYQRQLELCYVNIYLPIGMHVNIYVCIYGMYVQYVYTTARLNKGQQLRFIGLSKRRP